MGIRTGLIPALILIKKRLSSESRLQKLKSNLSKHPLRYTHFYQIPLKLVFQGIAIALFLFVLDIIFHKISEQIGQNSANLPIDDLAETIWLMKMMYYALMIWIVYRTKIRRVDITKNTVIFTQYGLTTYGKKWNLKIRKEDDLWIGQQGESKFWYNTHEYVIFVGKDGRPMQILRRSSIFGARKALIQICNVLKKETNLKIKSLKS